MEEIIKEKEHFFMFLDALDLSMDSIEEATDTDIFGADENNVFDENKNNENADVDPDEIFKTDEQEIVGGESKEIEEDDVIENNEKDSSPKQSKFYSSALKALKDDGILPDLEDEFINSADTPDLFAEAIERQVAARLDSTQSRIKSALDAGVEPSDIKKYENAISYLEGIDSDKLSDESEAGINLRKQIIYQDYINKGFKPERAQREVAKSFNSENDVEDAKAALESNIEYFKDEYNSVVEQNAAAIKARNEELKNQAIAFKNKALNTEDTFGIKIDKSIRQKIYENSVKQVHKDVDGKLITEMQKYSKENPIDAEYFFSLFYTMTDGFKNIDKFIGKKVSQNTRKSLVDLENKLRNTPLRGDGAVNFDFSEDPESVFSNVKLDF